MLVKELIEKLLNLPMTAPITLGIQDIGCGDYDEYAPQIKPVERFSDKKVIFYSLRAGDEE